MRAYTRTHARTHTRATQRGHYLKLSETGAKRLRSTVLLPGPAVKWLYSLLEYYVRECAAG